MSRRKIQRNLLHRPGQGGLVLETLERRTLPSFITAPGYSVGTQPYSVAAGDWDSDGDLDLTTANYYLGTLSVLLNNGDGTFQPRSDYAVDCGARSVAAADFNRDGALDLVSANFCFATVSVL